MTIFCVNEDASHQWKRFMSNLSSSSIIKVLLLQILITDEEGWWPTISKWMFTNTFLLDYWSYSIRFHKMYSFCSKSNCWLPKPSSLGQLLKYDLVVLKSFLTNNKNLNGSNLMFYWNFFNRFFDLSFLFVSIVHTLTYLVHLQKYSPTQTQFYILQQ